MRGGFREGSGRPTLDDGIKREVQIAFRVSKEKKDSIMARAGSLGLTLSQYLVMLVEKDLKKLEKNQAKG